MTAESIHALIAEAALAPSVHNVQPARWRIEKDGATLIEALDRRLLAGDPSGRDAAISLGAAAEGFRLAASRRCHGVDIEMLREIGDGSLRPVARLRLVEGGGTPDPLAEVVAQRRSFRAAFAKTTPADRAAAAALAGDDTAVISDDASLREAGAQLDAASWAFMRDNGFRGELRSWMRLSRRHPDWARDGLNADAMAMGPVAATGAGLVLGPLFAPLRALGLARPLLAEGERLAGDAAILIFHRPAVESSFDSGAHFYRSWLRIEAAGFGANVLAALADDAAAAAWARSVAAIPEGHRLVSSWRIGRVPPGKAVARARLPLDELILS